MILSGVELDGLRTDVRVAGGRVAQVGRLRPRPGEEVVDAGGGALLPGLHDHHVHLLATAAARSSVDVSAGLAPLATSTGNGWLRAVGWTQDGDRHAVDAVRPDRPVRVQHRSGALWVLNSAAVHALDLAAHDHPGIERDAAGRPTGRLWRADPLLARLLPAVAPDLSGTARLLAGFGVTGVTDATPDLSPPTCRLLRASVPQRLLLLGDPDGAGPVKVVLPDSDLPPLPDLVARLRALRPRPVAVHCVTRVALVLLLAALEEVGRVPGDRVEHAAVVPAALAAGLPDVVTQPGFLADRGDDYLRDLPPEDLEELYPYAGLLAAGTTAVPSSDAPYGPLDPWQVLAAARDRRSRLGRVLGPAERVPVRTALEGMLRPLDDLRAPARRVRAGVPADLVLLHVPLAAALDRPDAAHVRATWVAGRCLAGELPDEEAA